MPAPSVLRVQALRMLPRAAPTPPSRLLVSLPFRWSKVFPRSPSSEVLVSRNLTLAGQSLIRRLCKIPSRCELSLGCSGAFTSRHATLQQRHFSAASLSSQRPRQLHAQTGTRAAARRSSARVLRDRARWTQDRRSAQRSVVARSPRLSVPGLPRGLRISARVQTFAAADPAVDTGRDCCSRLTAAEATLCGESTSACGSTGH